MKEWWLQLNLREKQMVSLGIAVLILGLFYLILWSPLHQSVATARDQIEHNQKLLYWMENADKQIQAAELTGQKPAAHSSGSRISIVQNNLKPNPINNNVTQLVQADNDSVKLSFQQVSFDLLISWLIDLWQQEGFITTQMTVKPGNKPGIVTAELVVH